MRFVKINNQTNPYAPVLGTEYCDSFFEKFRGLMFRASLETDRAILLAEKSESIINTSIHMMFMRFPIGVLWLDKNYMVVDKRLAQPWRLAYAPGSPAQFVIEMHPDQLINHHPGDQLVITDA